MHAEPLGEDASSSMTGAFFYVLRGVSTQCNGTRLIALLSLHDFLAILH